MIKNIICRLLGRNQQYVVKCGHKESYKDLYYIVNEKSKNMAIRKVIDHDKESINHEVESTIDADIFISRDETFYVNMIAIPNKHILITAPEDTVINIIKSRYCYTLGVFGISVYKISGIL